MTQTERGLTKREIRIRAYSDEIFALALHAKNDLGLTLGDTLAMIVQAMARFSDDNYRGSSMEPDVAGGGSMPAHLLNPNLPELPPDTDSLTADLLLRVLDAQDDRGKRAMTHLIREAKRVARITDEKERKEAGFDPLIVLRLRYDEESNLEKEIPGG